MSNRRNLILCGFSQVEKNSTNLSDIRERKDMWYGDDYTHRFPYLLYVNTLEEAFQHQGFLLIINCGIRNIVEIDKNYRKKFKNYDMIMVVTDNNEALSKPDQYSGIYKISKNYLYGLFYMNVEEIYRNYKKEIIERPHYIAKKLDKMEQIIQLLKSEGSIKTKIISERLSFNDRNVERYMQDINLLYNNIGYDYSKNEWYITK